MWTGDVAAAFHENGRRRRSKITVAAGQYRRGVTLKIELFVRRAVWNSQAASDVDVIERDACGVGGSPRDVEQILRRRNRTRGIELVGAGHAVNAESAAAEPSRFGIAITQFVRRNAELGTRRVAHQGGTRRTPVRGDAERDYRGHRVELRQHRPVVERDERPQARGLAIFVERGVV